MAEELAEAMGHSGYENEKLEMFDGAVGFIVEFKHALDMDKDEDPLGTCGLCNDSSSYERFMVGGGPKKHYFMDVCGDCTM